MQITLTHADIDSALPRIAEGLRKYCWLQGRLPVCDVRFDAEFRRTFNGFYRVRRNASWQKEFYELLEALKGHQVRFRDVLESLHRAAGRYEASFASKLVATLDPQMPVIDSIVLRNIGTRLLGPWVANRPQRLQQLHSEMVIRFNEFLRAETGRYLVNQYRVAYPEREITEVKILDLVLWQVRPARTDPDWPNADVPPVAAGVYAVWEGDRLIYCGMSGRGFEKALAGQAKLGLVTWS